MASSTPSAPIINYRGAADTTALRIRFSTPSAQFRIPVGDLIFPLPPLLLTPYYLGKNYLAAENLFGGRIFIWRLNKYPGGRGCAKNLKKILSHSVKNFRTVPKIPHSISLYIELNYTLSLYIDSNYTLSLYIEPNYTLSEYIEPNCTLS